MTVPWATARPMTPQPFRARWTPHSGQHQTPHGNDFRVEPAGVFPGRPLSHFGTAQGNGCHGRLDHGRWPPCNHDLGRRHAVCDQRLCLFARGRACAFDSQGGEGSICFDLNLTTSGVPGYQSQAELVLRLHRSSGANIGVRIGAGALQSSENMFINCHFTNLTTGLMTCNANALQNQIHGGNFQACKTGIHMGSGSCPIIMGVGFQNWMTQGPDDYDIRIDYSAYDTIHISGCRTESANFVFASAGVDIKISACSQTQRRGRTVAQQLGLSASPLKTAFRLTARFTLSIRRRPSFRTRNSVFNRGMDWLEIPTRQSMVEC